MNYNNAKTKRLTTLVKDTSLCLLSNSIRRYFQENYIINFITIIILEPIRYIYFRANVCKPWFIRVSFSF